MKHIFPTNNYVVYDFETTGLNDQTDAVIQIAAMKKKDGVWHQPFNTFVKIDTPLPDKIIEITQITDEILNTEGIDAKDAWKGFYDYNENLPLIGHNIVNFDCKFLERFYKEHEFALPDSRRYVDTAMLFKALKLDQEPFWYETHYDFAKRIGSIRAFGIKYKLILCCEELGIDISHLQAHRADSDIQMTNLIYEYFVEKL